VCIVGNQGKHGIDAWRVVVSTEIISWCFFTKKVKIDSFYIYKILYLVFIYVFNVFAVKILQVEK
jgi:hypothetical protein